MPMCSTHRPTNNGHLMMQQQVGQGQPSISQMTLHCIIALPNSILYNKGIESTRMSSRSDMANPGGLGNLACILLILFVVNGINCGVFVPILQQNQNINPIDGSYSYSYATANGIHAAEQGKLLGSGTPQEGEAVDGFYTYLNSDGTLVNVRYVADLNGFRAVPSVVYRPALLYKAASVPGPVHFRTYDELRKVLTLR